MSSTLEKNEQYLDTLVGGKKRKKRKIKVYTDKKGKYIRNKGRKIRIKTKGNLSERELIKFLVQHLKPKRLNRKREKKNPFEEKESKTPQAIANSSVRISLPDFSASSLSVPSVGSIADIGNNGLSAMQQDFEDKYQKANPPKNAPKPNVDKPNVDKPNVDKPNVDDKKNVDKPVVFHGINDNDDDMSEAEMKKMKTELTKALKDVSLSQKERNELQEMKNKIEEELKMVKEEGLNYKKRIITNRTKRIQKLEGKLKAINGQYENYFKKEIDAFNDKDLEKTLREVYKVKGARNLNKKQKVDAYFEKAKGSADYARIDRLVNQKLDEERKDIENELKEELYDQQQEGNGRKYETDDGMSNIQIDNIMKKNKEYLGTIAHNQIESHIVPKVKPRSKGCFVYNTSPASGPGQHWRACYFDATPGGSNTIECYDSYADKTDNTVLKGIKQIVQKLNAPVYLKMKENSIRKQGYSGNCGWFCIKFLLDRLRGRPFAECSGYNDMVKGEKDIEKFKKKYDIHDFTYFDQNGEGIGDVIKAIGNKIGEKVGDTVKAIGNRMKIKDDDFIGPVRSFIHKFQDAPITSVALFRKPLDGYITRIANYLTNGRLAENQKALNYRDIYHVGIIVELNNNPGLVFKIEKNEVINISKYKTDKKATIKHVKENRNGIITVKNMFLKALELFKKQGLNMYLYQVAPIGTKPTNNCQVFARNLIMAMGAWNGELEKWLMQDAGRLMAGFDNIVKVATNATNLSARIQNLIHG